MKKNISKLTINEKGLTLLEVLIAISIMGFISLGIYNITKNSFDTAETVTLEDRERLQVETAMARLEWDFSHMYSPLMFTQVTDPTIIPASQGEEYNQMVDLYNNNNRFQLPTTSVSGYLPVPLQKFEDKDTIIFFTNGNRRKIQNSKQSMFAWIKYSFDTDDSSEGGHSMLVRKSLNENVFAKDQIEWEKIKSQVLLRKITKFKFEFWDPNTRKWLTSLNSIKNGSNVFYGVKLSINWMDRDKIENVFVRVFRPLNPPFESKDWTSTRLPTPGTVSTKETENEG